MKKLKTFESYVEDANDSGLYDEMSTLLVKANMVLASQAYKNKVFPIVEGKKINIHYSKELRHFVAIKGFPLQEYYLELLEIISSEKLFHDDFY